MSNYIHHSALVDPEVEMGVGNYIGPNTVILSPCIVGNYNWISGASIGLPAEHRAHPPAEDPSFLQGYGVVIGDHCVIREFATINSGIDSDTVISNDCYLMTKSHVAHDVFIGHRVTLACGVQIAGRAVINEGTNLGLGAVIHQRKIIGKHVMVGMQAAVTKDLPDYCMAYGVPAKVVGVNRRKMEALMIAGEEIEDLEKLYRK